MLNGIQEIYSTWNHETLTTSKINICSKLESEAFVLACIHRKYEAMKPFIYLFLCGERTSCVLKLSAGSSNTMPLFRIISSPRTYKRDAELAGITSGYVHHTRIAYYRTSFRGDNPSLMLPWNFISILFSQGNDGEPLCEATELEIFCVHVTQIIKKGYPS